MKPEGSGRAGVFSSSPMTDAVVVGAVGGERKRPALRCRWILPAAGGADWSTRIDCGRKAKGAEGDGFCFSTRGRRRSAGFLSMDYASVPALRNRFGFEWGPALFWFFYYIISDPLF